MLVLTRRRKDGVRIGNGVRVVVLGISGDQVKLGIEAPADQSILRDEVFERVARSNGQAARARADSGKGEGWVHVGSAKLGSLRVPSRDVIEIEGMPGFSELRRFVLIAHDRGEGVAWLTSCEDARVALPVVDLRSLRAEVGEQLALEELARVGARDASGVELLGILNTSGPEPRVSLDAPLLIHRESRRGVQLIRERPLSLV